MSSFQTIVVAFVAILIHVTVSKQGRLSEVPSLELVTIPGFNAYSATLKANMILDEFYRIWYIKHTHMHDVHYPEF